MSDKWITVRTWTFPGEGTRIVRDVWEHDPTGRPWQENQGMCRVEWLTPGGWIEGVEGGKPPAFDWNLTVNESGSVFCIDIVRSE